MTNSYCEGEIFSQTAFCEYCYPISLYILLTVYKNCIFLAILKQNLKENNYKYAKSKSNNTGTRHFRFTTYQREIILEGDLRKCSP